MPNYAYLVDITDKHLVEELSHAGKHGPQELYNACWEVIDERGLQVTHARGGGYELVRRADEPDAV